MGVTFKYNDNHVPEGLITGKKIYLVLARGGLYPETFDNDVTSLYDFSIQYMQTVLTYIGMRDITVIKADGLAIPGVKDQAMDKAIQSIEEIDLSL
jgi:FMN-dependent NADH-azoreductase